MNKNLIIIIKIMKKLFLLVIVFMTTIVTFAQDTLSKSPEQRTAQFVKQLKKELKLTTEQTEKIESIQLKSLKQVDSIKVNAVAQDKKEMNKKVREITKAANVDIKAILTDDQKIKFDTWLAEKKDKTKNKFVNKEKETKEH
jgi:hypothetical protein